MHRRYIKGAVNGFAGRSVRMPDENSGRLSQGDSTFEWCRQNGRISWITAEAPLALPQINALLFRKHKNVGNMTKCNATSSFKPPPGHHRRRHVKNIEGANPNFGRPKCGKN